MWRWDQASCVGQGVRLSLGPPQALPWSRTCPLWPCPQSRPDAGELEEVPPSQTSSPGEQKRELADSVDGVTARVCGNSEGWGYSRISQTRCPGRGGGHGRTAGCPSAAVSAPRLADQGPVWASPRVPAPGLEGPPFGWKESRDLCFADTQTESQ